MGEPIRSPGSWIWRFAPAIVPVEAVVDKFIVSPCNRDSILPGNRVLEKPFCAFFNRASDLYSSTFGAAAKKRSSEEFERLPLSLPAREPGADVQVEAHEREAVEGGEVADGGEREVQLLERGALRQRQQRGLVRAEQVGQRRALQREHAERGEALERVENEIMEEIVRLQIDRQIIERMLGGAEQKP